jgi:cytochrome oxidase Cu insertion factor (SCO1/SenC/PrrC family)
MKLPKVLRDPFVIAFVVGAAVLTLSVPFFRRVPPAPAPIGAMPAWSFEDQDGRAVTSAGLGGRTYLLAMVSPTCGQACVRVGHDLAALESKLHEMKADVPLVVVSPVESTAVERAAFVASSGGDGATWRMLGGPPDATCALAQGSFARAAHVIVPCARVHDLAHDPHVLIVDGEGRMRASIKVDLEGLDEALHRSLAVLENRPIDTAPN